LRVVVEGWLQHLGCTSKPTTRLQQRLPQRVAARSRSGRGRSWNLSHGEPALAQSLVGAETHALVDPLDVAAPKVARAASIRTHVLRRVQIAAKAAGDDILCELHEGVVVLSLLGHLAGGGGGGRADDFGER